MDLSGLIFVALALVWALVLIPKALRAHDDVARTRSVDASSDDARVLTRRGRPEATPEVDERPSDPATILTRQRHLAARAARRRRRVLGVLVLLTLATGVAGATGLLLPWAVALPGATIPIFLLVARVTVRREHAAWERRARALRDAARSGTGDDAAGASSEVAEPPAAATPEPELIVVARNDQGVAVVSDTEDTSTFDASSLRAAVAAAPPTLWDPLPVTLPTYVSKPRATRSVRTIDLGAPGVASSGHSAADTALVADAAADEGQEPPAQRAVGS